MKREVQSHTECSKRAFDFGVSFFFYLSRRKRMNGAGTTINSVFITYNMKFLELMLTRRQKHGWETPVHRQISFKFPDASPTVRLAVVVNFLFLLRFLLFSDSKEHAASEFPAFRHLTNTRKTEKEAKTQATCCVVERRATLQASANVTSFQLTRMKTLCLALCKTSDKTRRPFPRLFPHFVIMQSMYHLDSPCDRSMNKLFMKTSSCAFIQSRSCISWLKKFILLLAAFLCPFPQCSIASQQSKENLFKQWKICKKKLHAELFVIKFSNHFRISQRTHMKWARREEATFFLSCISCPLVVDYWTVASHASFFLMLCHCVRSF